MSGGGNPKELLALAEKGRVDIGTYSPVQLHQWGIRVSGVEPAAKPLPPERLPEGPRAFRQLTRPPLPHLVAIVAEDDGERSHTIRDADLITPSVARASELRRGESRHLLSVAPLAVLLEGLWTDAGLLAAPPAPRRSRLFLAFPTRWWWQTTARRLRSPTVTLQRDVLPEGQKVWLDIAIVADPSGGRTVTQTSAGAAEVFPPLPTDATPAQIAARVGEFSARFWDSVGPGPYPGAG